jgi:PAS domain S-box-containing protein
VAVELGCSVGVAREQLSALVDAGDLHTKQVDGTTRVWWPTASESAGASEYWLLGERDGIDEVLQQILQTSPVGISVVGPGGRIRYANDRMASILGRQRGEIVGMTHRDPEWDIYYPDGTRIPEEDHPVTQVLETGEPIFGFEHQIEIPGEGEKWLSSNSAPVPGDGGFVVVAVEDITNLKQHERRLEEKNEELTRLDRVNSVIRAVLGAVVDAESADDVERTVCSALAGSEPYRLAVVGHFSPSYEEFTTRNAAGVGQEYLQELVSNPGAPAIDRGIGAKAARTGETQVVQDVGGLPWDHREEPVKGHGIGSYVSIPLVYRGTTYGVLSVYAGEPLAFDERERAVLDELGDAVAHGLHVTTRESELRKDQAVELTFSSRTLTAPFRREGLGDLRVHTDSIVHIGEDEQLQYCTVRDVPPREYLDVLSEFPWVVDARLVATTDESFRAEVKTSGDTAMSILDDHGGAVTSIVVQNDTATVTTRVPRSADVGTVTEAIEGMGEGQELVDRSLVQTPQSLRRVIEPALTDRQTTVLRMAHSAGYFERPRKSTGEDLADRLGVTPTTFHRHLRNAETRVFRQLYEEEEWTS